MRAYRCTEQGYTTHTCSRCEDSFIDTYVSAKGHTPGAAATCTEDQVCTACGTVLAEKLGHDYVITVTAPTCTEPGYTTHTCSRCGYEIHDTYQPAQGHSYINGLCRYCRMIDPAFVYGDIPKITLSSFGTVAGGHVELELKIVNNPGFSSLNMALVFDEKYLTLSRINNCTTMAMTSETSLLWDDWLNHESDSTLAKMTFNVAKNAPNGTYPIHIVFFDASNEGAEDVIFLTVDGNVYVSDPIYGDANGDTKISTIDLSLMRRYLASRDPLTGLSPLEIFDGADCNGDGRINTVDLSMLRQYLANRDPLTGESSYIMGPKR